MTPETGGGAGLAFKSAGRETAPTLAFRSEKTPTDKGWRFG